MRLLYEGRKGYILEYRIHVLDYPMHVDHAVEVFLCTAGKSTVLCGDGRYEIGPGDIFFCFPNQPHGYVDSDQVEGYILIAPVKPLLAPYHRTLMYQHPVCPVVRQSGWQQGDIGTLLRMAYSECGIVSETVMQGYLLVLTGKLLSLFSLEQGNSGAEDAVRKIILYLNDHYTEPVTRKQLASAVGYNESYISHIFSQNLKTTLPKYLNTLRVYDASRFLRETEMTVAEITSMLGFGSIRNFNRVFLGETGKTPSAYRAEKSS